MSWLWKSTHYWPLWMAVMVGSFLFRELWALAGGKNSDTLSDWTWNQLHIVRNETIGQWSATDLLVFCVYVSIFIAWLPWHFFFHRFP